MLTHYFDFHLIPDLRFRNLGKTIQHLREKYHHKQKYLSSRISITPSLLSKYELDKTAIPIRLFTNVLSVYDQTLLDFLSNYKQLTFQTHRSSCQFPTHHSDSLFAVLKGLQLKEGGYFAVIGLPDYSLTKYKSLLSNCFSIPKPQTHKFYNICLSRLIQEFCILRN
ncbi:MAG: helix-turn-helix transcriptional regulator [Candidatus Heimdallarchaeota archaeon]